MSEAFSPRLEAVLDTVRPLADRFAAAGHRLYLVGGIVRDHLVGRVPDEHDFDATTDARPPQIKKLLAGFADAVWTQGERFGTIGCAIGGDIYEITTHRAESYDDHSRKPTVAFGDRIDDDLVRRDFTVNAMAIDVADRALIDPFGGRDDLLVHVLRTPLDPEVSFSEDPLRMLRAARFHAGYGLEPVPELRSAIAAMVDRISIVSVERIRDELQKLLLVDDPGPGLHLLVETGLFARVLPDLELHAVPIAARRVRAVAADPAMRWAALLLDADVSVSRLRERRFSGRLVDDVVWLRSVAPSITDAVPLDASEPAIRRAAARTPHGRRLEDLVDFVTGIRTADDRPVEPVAHFAQVLAELRSREPDLDDPVPALTGTEVATTLGLQEGPDIGTAMTWLRERRFEEGPIGADDARRRLREWWPHRSAG